MSALETVKKQSEETGGAIPDSAEASAAGIPAREEIKAKARAVKERVVEASQAVVTRAKSAVKPGLTETILRRVRRLMHAGLGAIALINDERRSLTQRCVERGEVVETDTREATTRLFKELKRLSRREEKRREAA